MLTYECIYTKLSCFINSATIIKNPIPKFVLYGSRRNLKAGSCKHGNESSSFTTSSEYLKDWRNYEPFKKDPAALNTLENENKLQNVMNAFKDPVRKEQ
jgi:hypothetical protein